jgi:hypothetical protein
MQVIGLDQCPEADNCDDSSAQSSLRRLSALKFSRRLPSYFRYQAARLI